MVFYEAKIAALGAVDDKYIIDRKYSLPSAVKNNPLQELYAPADDAYKMMKKYLK